MSNAVLAGCISVNTVTNTKHVCLNMEDVTCLPKPRCIFKQKCVTIK